jgi:predicted nucleic acid-binding protein
MRLVDTSAWIEWLTGTPLGARLAADLPDRAQWLVPTIVQLELAKWLTREVGEEKADLVIAFTQTCSVAELDTATALSAADLCARYRLATADAIVYATALSHRADLLTCDRRFENLPGVHFVRKPSR